MSYYGDGCKFSVLIGKTLESVQNNKNEEIRFVTTDGEQYSLYHNQDCCETVQVEDVVGDLSDLVGSPIVMAEEATSAVRPPDAPKPDWEPESQTWTFYKLATVKGYVTIRWFGSSNGYYSETVDFRKIGADDE